MVTGIKSWPEGERPREKLLQHVALTGSAIGQTLLEDFDEAVRWLKERGVGFQTEPWESAGCRMATIFDPDGNCVAIHKLKTPA